MLIHLIGYDLRSVMIRTTHTDDKTNDLLVSNEELNLDNEDTSAWVVFDGIKFITIIQ